MGWSLTAFCVKLIYNTESFYIPCGISACFSGKQKLSLSLFCFACMLGCFLYDRTYDCYCRRSVWKYLSINEIALHKGDVIHPRYSKWKFFWILVLPGLHSLPAPLPWLSHAPSQSKTHFFGDFNRSLTIPKEVLCPVLDTAVSRYESVKFRVEQRKSWEV